MQCRGLSSVAVEGQSAINYSTQPGLQPHHRLASCSKYTHCTKTPLLSSSCCVWTVIWLELNWNLKCFVCQCCGFTLKIDRPVKPNFRCNICNKISLYVNVTQSVLDELDSDAGTKDALLLIRITHTVPFMSDNHVSLQDTCSDSQVITMAGFHHHRINVKPHEPRPAFKQAPVTWSRIQMTPLQSWGRTSIFLASYTDGCQCHGAGCHAPCQAEEPHEAAQTWWCMCRTEVTEVSLSLTHTLKTGARGRHTLSRELCLSRRRKHVDTLIRQKANGLLEMKREGQWSSCVSSQDTSQTLHFAGNVQTTSSKHGFSPVRERTATCTASWPSLLTHRGELAPPKQLRSESSWCLNSQ